VLRLSYVVLGNIELRAAVNLMKLFCTHNTDENAEGKE
jgi:hypothetical protein